MVPDHTRCAHPTASGRLQTVVLFRQSYPALTNGGVVDAVVPCGTRGNSLTTWARDFHIEIIGSRVRDDSGRSPRCRRTVWHRARKAACSSNC